MKNNLGRNSLLIALFGTLLLHLSIYYYSIESTWMHIILAGFEAGLIGAFADWFAVTALFRRVPIPFISKHTNIIVKNRKKITNGVVDLLTNQWLTPEVIINKLKKVDFSEKLINLLKVPSNKKYILYLGSKLIEKFLENIDDDLVVDIFDNELSSHLGDINISEAVGKQLSKSVTSGDFNEVWNAILNSVQGTINDQETKYFIYGMIDEKVEEYANENPLKRLMVNLGEATNVIDKPSIVYKLIDGVNKSIEDIKSQPNHPFRKNIDKTILEFSDGLVNGDAEKIYEFNKIRDKLISNIDTRNLIQSILKRFKVSLTKKTNTEKIEAYLDKYFEKMLVELNNDFYRKSVNDYSLKTIVNLVTSNHSLIGNMVEENLSNLNDYDLVSQIESKVGDDLQYIRLNGAVVGGFIGVIIALIKIIPSML